MTNILFHAELFPIRESFTQHFSIASKYVELVKSVRHFGGRSFVLANNETADRLVDDNPDAAFYLMRPNAREEENIRRDLAPWDVRSIERWVSFATMSGAVSAPYETLLRRIHKDFPFDVIVTWGDNEAVNVVASEVGADVLHLELGPTRNPFPETFYFDSVGTNSRASFRENRGDLAPQWPSRDFWVAAWMAKHNSEKVPGFYDMPLMYANAPQNLGFSLNDKLCYIPLQLADDLNTQLGSSFTSPRHFLETTLPNVVDAGYKAIIKVHPMASSRSFNLIAEREALQFARSLGDQVVIVEEDDHRGIGNWLIANSDVVLTINSSVGFEAAVLGTPVVLAGEAAYDLGHFPRYSEKPFDEIVSEIDFSRIEKSVACMLGDILYPSSILPSRNFARALMESARNSEDEDFAQRLRTSLGSPVDYALNEKFGSPVIESAVLPANPSSLKKQPVLLSGNKVLIGNLSFELDPSAFEAGIEKSGPDATSNRYTISGWAFEPGRRVPPLMILISDGKRVVDVSLSAEKRQHLDRKKLVTNLAGFSATIDNVPDKDWNCILVTSDLRCQILPTSIGRYKSGSHKKQGQIAAAADQFQ